MLIPVSAQRRRGFFIVCFEQKNIAVRGVGTGQQ